MNEKLNEKPATRQQRRAIRRKYEKHVRNITKRLHKKYGGIVRSDLLDISRFLRKDDEGFMFPSYQFKPQDNIQEWQSGMRDMRDSIGMAENLMPPTMYVVVIMRPHPYESDEEAEKISRTIVSEALDLSILCYLFLDGNGNDYIPEDECNEAVTAYIKDNEDTIIEKLDVIAGKFIDRIIENPPQEKEETWKDEKQLKKR